MQSISPLISANFKDKSNIVISKVEIDSDGAGTYLELPDVSNFSISTNIENQVGRLCSYSFSITVLNTDNQFYPYNTGSSYYNYLKQGRRIKLYTGLKVGETEKYFPWILGRIDEYRLNEQAGKDICTITGRCLMRIITEYRVYPPNTYWGTNHTYNTVANQIRYDMETDCKGIYKVELDYTNKDGTALEEIYENTDWSYDWHNNELIFTPQRIPDFAGTDNLKVYYFQTQSVEDVVGHILYLAGIFATTGARDDWIDNTDYVTPTSKTIDRVWFNTGTSALEVIRLLSEVVRYRLYFDYTGNPIFKPKASIGSSVDTFLKSDITIENVEENEEETYTHIIVIGEERDRIIGEDEIAPDVPSGLSLSTGLGVPTQASLAWIKAEWDANTESDFGHYELRIRKIGYSDYTEVSTIAITFIWYVLEPGVTYGVQIRAVDIYNNRSDWSTEETILTATDETTPAQITGGVATAGLAGIKITWEGATEGDIAGYKIERQESDNGVTWIGAWIERARINATMWLDLHLPYAKYYRYRISAYTQAGVFGPTSTPTADSIKATQAGHDDIVANCITADLIWGNELSAIFADLGTITAGTITLNTTGFIRSSGKTYGSATAGFWMGYSAGYKVHIGTNTKYLKWDGANLNIKGNLIITGGEGIANLADAGDLATQDSIAYAAITGAKPPINADYFGGVAGILAYYNMVSAALLDSTIIIGGYIRTSLLTANNIRTGTLDTIRLNVGYGTNNDIYFKDSGIRMYDIGNYKIGLYKSGYSSLFFGIATDGVNTGRLNGSFIGFYNNNNIILNAVSRSFMFYTTGTLRLPSLYYAPAGHNGDITYNSASGWFAFYAGGQWKHVKYWTTTW